MEVDVLLGVDTGFRGIGVIGESGISDCVFMGVSREFGPVDGLYV